MYNNIAYFSLHTYSFSGGIQLVFIGANLNSVHSPTITITDSRLIPSSVEVSIIHLIVLYSNVSLIVLCH